VAETVILRPRRLIRHKQRAGALAGTAPRADLHDPPTTNVAGEAIPAARKAPGSIAALFLQEMA